MNKLMNLKYIFLPKPSSQESTILGMIGEIMKAQADAGMMATAGRPQEIGLQTNPIISPPTLSEMAIDKNLADRARKLAAIVACFTLMGSTSLAFAQDYNGWCFDVGGQGCDLEDVRIEGRSYSSCEDFCTLTNPVPVRGLDAVLLISTQK